MVGDMFNHGLKNTVNNLCGELSNALANQQIFLPVPQGGGGGNNWWPGDLGIPSSSGSQNQTRYAYFPQTRRLAVQRDGQVSVFDTLNHQIGGVSQQQGGSDSLTFTSQFGTISSLGLPLVSGPGLQSGNAPHPPSPAPTNFAPAPQNPPSVASGNGGGDILVLLEKLGQLKAAGILTDQEFDNKKADLLGRL